MIPIELPSINCSWLYEMTDDTGILQHAKSSIGDRREGYTSDDNARALLVVLRYFELQGNPKILEFAKIYLGFLLYAQMKDGRIHNIIGYNHSFLDAVGSDESLGRALWTCGYAQDTAIPDDMKIVAKDIFDRGLAWTSESSSPRAWAFAILGLYHYAKTFPEDKNPLLNVIQFADRLCELFERTSSSTWQWFEPYVTYGNPRLPHSLFRAYQVTGRKEYLDIAERTLEFLAANDIVNDVYHPVGNKSWYNKGGKKALYDQQPLEASCMAEAASIAYQVTGKQKYSKMAWTAFNWFMGKNSNNVVVYNPTTGGAFDGISTNGLNLNQGAEAGLSYLLARLEMEVLIQHESRIKIK